MSDNLYKLFTEQFSTNLELKLQQMGSKLRGKIGEGSHTGKQASPVNQIGAIALRAPAGQGPEDPVLRHHGSRHHAVRRV